MRTSMIMLLLAAASLILCCPVSADAQLMFRWVRPDPIMIWNGEQYKLPGIPFEEESEGSRGPYELPIFEVDMPGGLEVEEIRRKAGAGDHDMQMIMGVLSYRGRRGVDRDWDEAVRWFGLAAEGGDSRAKNTLGVFYLCGICVPQHYRMGKRWLYEAGGEGNVFAGYNIGTCSFLGLHGFDRDFREAERWLGRVAGECDGNAWYFLGLINLARRDNGRAYGCLSLAHAKGCDEAERLRDAVRLTIGEKEIQQNRTMGGYVKHTGVKIIGPRDR